MTTEPNSGPVQVLIVEDHQVVAEGLCALLDDHPGLHVQGWAPTVADATRSAEQERVDVAVLDFWLPDGSGVDAAAGIRRHRPEAAVVFVSADDSDQAMIAAIEAGASGYLIKTASGEEIVDAILRAAAGEMLIPASRLHELLTRSREATRERSDRAQALASLTTREREILAMMSKGLDNREISARLNIAYPTVRSHVRKVLEKLGARSKLEAVVKAAAAEEPEGSHVEDESPAG